MTSWQCYLDKRQTLKAWGGAYQHFGGTPQDQKVKGLKMDKNTQSVQKKENVRINFLRGLEEQDDARGKEQNLKARLDE